MNFLITLIRLLSIISITAAGQKSKTYYFISEQNTDEDWSSKEELTSDPAAKEEEFGENNDFKFDDQSTFKNSAEEQDAANELDQFWSIDMCNDVNCKSDQICVANKANVAVCVDKRQVATMNSDRQQHSPTIKKRCNKCPDLNTNDIYCASNNRSYSSLCELIKYNCEQSSDYRPLCQDECPCNRKVNLNKKLKLDYLWRYVNSFEKVNKRPDPGHHKRQQKKSSLNRNSKQKSKPPPITCSTRELNEMGQRLYNWFAVVLKNQLLNSEATDHQSTKQIVTKIRASLVENCDEQVNFMFLKLDTNRDLKISLDELYHQEHDQSEKCLKIYMDSCDSNGDQVLNNNEWCSCFLRYRPCLKERNSLLSRNRQNNRNKLLVNYIQNCDCNGYFEPAQCNKFTKFCWCVDKQGNEIANTKKLGKVVCGDKAKATDRNVPHPIDDDSEGDDDFEDYQSENEGSGD